jgi:hypothetical protein
MNEGKFVRCYWEGEQYRTHAATLLGNGGEWAGVVWVMIELATTSLLHYPPHPHISSKGRTLDPIFRLLHSIEFKDNLGIFDSKLLRRED